jgi:hypothetical protein
MSRLANLLQLHLIASTPNDYASLESLKNKKAFFILMSENGDKVIGIDYVDFSFTNEVPRRLLETKFPEVQSY